MSDINSSKRNIFRIFEDNFFKPQSRGEVKNESRKNASLSNSGGRKYFHRDFMDFYSILVISLGILLLFYLGYHILIWLKKHSEERSNIQICSYCEIEIEKPYPCEYCQEDFCKNHRHPLVHKCKKISEHFPLYETCACCGETVYLPYRCQYCKKFFCGEHFLPFAHNCEKIDEWKNNPSRIGVTTELKNGKIFVRK